MPGPEVFGTGAASVFNTLTTVVGQLGSGTPTATQLNAALTALDANISTAEQASAVLGNGSDQVTAVSASLTSQLTSVQNTQAGLEDVNVATVTTQLDSEMTNYQAAMWAAVAGHPRDIGAFPVTRTAAPDGCPIVRVGTPHHLDRRSSCHRRPPPSARRTQLQTTVTPPVTLPCMEITFRREMLGWIGATHFLLDPIDGDIPGMFAELRCTDEEVSLRTGLPVPPPRFLMLTPWYVWPELSGGDGR